MLFAKNQGGQFLLRIEDTDKERSSDEYKANIFEGLKWLGLEWDEKPVIQSERINNHRVAIQALLDQGVAYRCYSSDSELEEMREAQKLKGLPPRYDNRHRDLNPLQEAEYKAKGRTAVVRFRIDDEKTIYWEDLVRGPMSWQGSDLGGDMVISRRAPADQIGDPLYNLVVVVDDSDMRISHVIRGEDHIANTAKQILLYEALGLSIPKFAHTPLILNSEGRKLSKRDGVTSISQFKNMGYTADAMANYMTLLGWSPPEGIGEQFSITEVEKVFNFSRVNKAGAKFDWEKLNWLNSQVLHSWTPEKLLKSLQPLWIEKGWKIPETSWCIDLLKLIGPSLTLLNDGVDQALPFFETPILQKDAQAQLENKEAIKAIKNLLDQIEKTPWDGLDNNQAKDILSIVAESSGLKKGLIMKSLRAALLRQMNGPDLLTSWGLLIRIGQDRLRLRSFI